MNVTAVWTFRTPYRHSHNVDTPRVTHTELLWTFHSYCWIILTLSVLTKQSSCFCCSSSSLSCQTRSVSQEAIPVPEGQYLKRASYSEHANTRNVDKCFTCSCLVGCLIKWKRGLNLLGIWVSMSQWGNDYSRLSLRKFSERSKQLHLIPVTHCVIEHSMTGLLILNLYLKKQLEQCTWCNPNQLRQILVVSDEVYYTRKAARHVGHF
jgi:hypothetical protein